MYVGKATEIRSRVASYFSGSDGRVMVPRLIEQADEVDYIVTKSPSEALTLERHLIKEHKPKFNSRLKDDKSYPYISLTKEEFPRIMYTRHPLKVQGLGGHSPMQELPRGSYNYLGSNSE